MIKKRIGVGIIGTGRRGYLLGICIVELTNKTNLEIKALCNRTYIRMEEAKRGLVARYRQLNINPSIALYTNYEDLIQDPSVDLIMIVTPQYAHLENAVPALRSGKRVFLDKPMAHNLKDAIAIRKEEIKAKNPMIMGFTRRYEKIWHKAYELVKNGVIGDVKMMLIRAILPYHVYFHNWVRRIEWSGGPLADKMSHYFDVFNWFANDYPRMLSSFGGRLVFLPEENAPKRCRECDRDCPYRIGVKEEKFRQDVMIDFSDSRAKENELIKIHDTCVWLPGANIDDHGLVNIVYPNGVKASLFWNLFGPDTDDQETFEIIGEKGKITLTRHIGKLDVVGDYGKYHKVFDEKSKDFDSSHFGADHRLIMELNNFAGGKAPIVSGKEGLEVAREVEAASRSNKLGGEPVLMTDIEDVSI